MGLGNHRLGGSSWGFAYPINSKPTAYKMDCHNIHDALPEFSSCPEFGMFVQQCSIVSVKFAMVCQHLQLPNTPNHYKIETHKIPTNQ